MRQLKFRVWNKDKMCFYNSNHTIGINNENTNIWSEVQQYTGLKDKNDKEIYEDDVVKNKVGEVGSIVFWDGCFYLAYHNEPAKQPIYDFLIKDKDYNSTGKTTLEVVGNLKKTVKHDTRI